MARILTLTVILTAYIVAAGFLATLSSVDSVARFSIAMPVGWMQVSARTGIPPMFIGWGQLRPLVPSEKRGALSLMMEQEAAVDINQYAEWQQKRFPAFGNFAWKGQVEDYPVYFIGGVPIQQMVIFNGSPHVRLEKTSRSWLEIANARNLVVGYGENQAPIINNGR